MPQPEEELMIFSFLDLNKEEQRVLLPLPKTLFNTMKEESEGLDFDDMEYFEHFTVLRDYLFNIFMLNPYEEKTKAFFKKAQLNQFDFKETHKTSQVKVIDVYYNVYQGDYTFIGAEPSNSFYTGYIVKDRLELRLESNIELLETVLEQFLDALGVDYTDFKEEDELSTFEMYTDGLVETFLLKCWQELKEDTQSNVFGMLFQATGCGGTTDLDNGESIKETNEDIKKYAKSKGITL